MNAGYIGLIICGIILFGGYHAFKPVTYRDNKPVLNTLLSIIVLHIFVSYFIWYGTWFYQLIN